MLEGTFRLEHVKLAAVRASGVVAVGKSKYAEVRSNVELGLRSLDEGEDSAFERAWKESWAPRHAPRM
jgi:hypothetical protein